MLKLREINQHMENELALKMIIQQLKETVELQDADLEILIPCLEIKKLKKKEFAIQPGQISRHMRFIAKGSMRCFYIDEENQEHTLQLGIENWWINDLYSFLSEKPSRMFVQAIEDTLIIQISQQKLEKLYSQIPAISNFFRIKMQSAYVALQERTIENMSTDAYERYQKFITTYRNIEQRVPQYMVASYLGITPEFLSYLKKKHLNILS